VVSTTEIEIAPLRGGQLAFFRDTCRHPALLGGVGGGKTFANVGKAFAYVLKHPGARIVLTEPTFPMVRDVLVPTIREMFGEAEGPLWLLNKGDYNIDVYNGSAILLRSALLMHPQFLAGLNLAAFGMDEGALGDQEPTFLALQARLRQQGYPHQGWLTGTPKGRNWVWRRWGPERKEQYTVHEAATAKNPYLPPDYLQSLRDSYGQTPFAQQELEGKFVAFGGLIYSQFDLKVHIQEPPKELSQVVAGVDFGLISPSAITVYGKAGSGRTWGIAEFYRRRCPLEDLLSAAVALSQEHKVGIFYCDPSGKEEIEMMRRLGLQAVPAPLKEVVPGIQLVSSLLNRQPDGKPGIYFSPQMVNTQAEFQQYQWREQRPGSSDYKDEPVKENDHAMDATRYALVGMHWAMRGEPMRITFSGSRT
jgi:phage terminase large subunit-like protein